MDKVKGRFYEDSNGFSLIEVIIAVIILAILIVPLMRGFVVTQKVSLRAGELEEFETLSQTIFEGSWNYSIEDIALMFNSESPDSFIVPTTQFTACKALGDYYDDGDFTGSESNIYQFAIDDLVVSTDNNQKYDVIVKYDASHYMGDESSSASRDASAYNYNAFEYSTAAVYDENYDYMFLMNEDDDDDAYEAIRVLLNDSTISDEEFKADVRREITVTVTENAADSGSTKSATVTANISYYYPADSTTALSVLTYAGGTYYQVSDGEPYPRNVFICYYPDYYSDYTDNNLLDYVIVNNNTSNEMSLIVAMQEKDNSDGTTLSSSDVQDYWVHLVVNDPNCTSPSESSPNVTVRTNLGYNLALLRDKDSSTSSDSCKDTNQAFIEYYYNSGTMNLNCWLSDMNLMKILPLDGSTALGNVVYDTTIEFYDDDTYESFTENYSDTVDPLLIMTSDEAE